MMTKTKTSRAYGVGCAAYWLGFSHRGNPYSQTSREASQWSLGFLDAQDADERCRGPELVHGNFYRPPVGHHYTVEAL